MNIILKNMHRCMCTLWVARKKKFHWSLGSAHRGIEASPPAPLLFAASWNEKELKWYKNDGLSAVEKRIKLKLYDDTRELLFFACSPNASSSNVNNVHNRLTRMWAGHMRRRPKKKMQFWQCTIFLPPPRRQYESRWCRLEWNYVKKW